MKNESVAIMQPYIFPYIGYFHLIESSNVFVFYDDANYMVKGWINRNRILNKDTDCLFTIPVAKASQNKLINETLPIIDEKWKRKFYKQLEYSYKKSPFYSDVIKCITPVFEKKYLDITDLCIESILSIYRYLSIDINYKKSSNCSPDTKGLEKADRLIRITKDLGYESYVNVPGGKILYRQDYFLKKGVSLSFVKTHSLEYKQYSNKFVPCLSIIDILMFNDKDSIVDLFKEYSLE